MGYSSRGKNDPKGDQRSSDLNQIVSWYLHKSLTLDLILERVKTFRAVGIKWLFCINSGGSGAKYYELNCVPLKSIC